MCLLVVSVNQRTDLPFLCMHNRDEDLSRPTVMPDPLMQTEIIYGHDALYKGSTWMGLNRRKGLFACLNNVRNKHYEEPDKAQRVSRGLLVQRFLTAPFLSVDDTKENKTTTEKGQAVVHQLGGHFPGFSMLHADLFLPAPVRCMLLSNRPHPASFGEDFKGGADVAAHVVVPDGCHAMSNGHFDDISWPKVKYVKDKVGEIIDKFPPLPSDPTEEKAAILALVELLAVPMSFEAAFDASLLPDFSFSSLPPDKEAANQRVFIPHVRGKAIPPLELSGTRSQTLVLRTAKHVYFFCRSTDDYPTMGKWIYSMDAIPATPSPVEVAAPKQFCVTGKRNAEEAGV